MKKIQIPKIKFQINFNDQISKVQNEPTKIY